MKSKGLSFLQKQAELMLSDLDDAVVFGQKGRRAPQKKGNRWASHIPKFFEPEIKDGKVRVLPLGIVRMMDGAKARYAQEKELVWSLLPATKQMIKAKTNLTNKRIEIALRGTWCVSGVYEIPTETAKLD